MPAYDQNNRRDIARSPRQTWGTSASAPTTINMRHHTSGNAESVSSLPRMAVKPQSSTQAWICRKALRVSVSGMHRLSPLDWTTGNPFAAGLALCFETIEAMTPRQEVTASHHGLASVERKRAGRRGDDGRAIVQCVQPVLQLFLVRAFRVSRGRQRVGEQRVVGKRHQ